MTVLETANKADGEVLRDGNWLFTTAQFIRWRLPYGLWTCADGREVLFDRFYRPICQRAPGVAPSLADPTERVRWASQRWFYKGRAPERQKKAAGLAALVAWDFVEPVMAAKKALKLLGQLAPTSDEVD